jgi:hypothetical protein
MLAAPRVATPAAPRITIVEGQRLALRAGIGKNRRDAGKAAHGHDARPVSGPPDLRMRFQVAMGIVDLEQG